MDKQDQKPKPQSKVHYFKRYRQRNELSARSSATSRELVRLGYLRLREGTKGWGSRKREGARVNKGG